MRRADMVGGPAAETAKVLRRLAVALVLLVLFVPGRAPAYAQSDDPVNLLPTACHFTTDVRERYPSLLSEALASDCETPAQRSPDMIWLSLNVAAVLPEPNTDYELAIYRHWAERAVIQFHYADGHMQDYDVGPYGFDRYWSVGNFMSFRAPARAAPVRHVLVGLQNPSSIKLFHQISLVEAEDWRSRETDGRFLTILITGVVLAMLVYNIALFVVLRFDFLFHYLLVVSAAVAYNVTAYGFLSYLLPGVVSYGAQMNITILALGISGMGGILFLCSFLEKGILTRCWVLTARTLAFLFFGLSVVFVNMRGPYTETLETSLHIISFAGVLFVLAALVRAARHRSRAALFYAVGWSLPIVGVIVRNLREAAIIPHSDLVIYSVSIGIALETVILSIGIADRIAQIRKDRDEAKVDREKAIAASDAKTEFLAHISHEIRNPMNAIIGLSDLAAQTDLTDEQRGYIRNIQTSGNVMMHILDGTLDFSKIEAGKVTLEEIEFAPQDVFDNVRAIIGPKAEEKGLSFRIDGEQQLPVAMRGDPTRFSQILINLANNAVKFTDRGRVVLAVSFDQLSENRIWLHCRITDTGIGMSADQIARLFQSFSQADVSVARKYGGTGLGLVISKQLVELMGGSIGVESVPGKGSNFYFSLPFDCVESANASAATDSELSGVSSPHTATSELQDRRILVVEDHPVNQQLVRKTLEDSGADVDVAADGREAVTKAGNNHYDAILMDLNMPGLGGIEATEAIRSSDKGSKVPIIAMTGSTDAETLEACKSVGISDHIIKPFHQAALRQTLERWCSATMDPNA